MAEMLVALSVGQLVVMMTALSARQMAEMTVALSVGQMVVMMAALTAVRLVDWSAVCLKQ